MPFYPQLEEVLMNLARSFSEIHIESTAQRILPVMEALEWVPLRKLGSVLRIGAVDSSFAALATRFAVLYVVQGLGLSPVARGGCVCVDAGTIPLEGLSTARGLRRVSPKRIVSVIAQLHELSIARNLVELGTEVVAMDGSALSFIMSRPVKRASKLEIRSITLGTLSVERILDERLRLVKELRDRLVFVAKSSNIALVTGDIPDMTLLEIARVKRIGSLWRRGRTRAFVVRLSDISKHLGIEGHREIMSEVVTIVYARFVDRGPTYQISFVGERSEDEIDRVVGALLECSPAGYPAPLESVHRLSKLSRRGVNNVLKKLGMPIIEGREVLE